MIQVLLSFFGEISDDGKLTFWTNKAVSIDIYTNFTLDDDV